MYVDSVSGTRKSHLIKSVIEFFCCQYWEHAMRLSTPMGIALVLIDGYTIHSLMGLPCSKNKTSEE